MTITTLPTYTQRAHLSFDALLNQFYIPAENLCLERLPRLPHDQDYAYVWPYTGVVAAANALAQLPGADQEDLAILRRALDGLEQYRDPEKLAYDSYVRRFGGGQKFYDDNQWIGMEFIHAYHLLNDSTWLVKAIDIFHFTLQGWSEERGGGIYWRENDFETKNTCSNGPGAVLALMLYQETNDEQYLDWAKRILDWVKQLKDPATGVYLDAVNVDGSIDRRTFTYNTGTPLHANALLYEITGDETYKREAVALIEAAESTFAQIVEGTSLRFFPNTLWFNGVLLRGALAFLPFDDSETCPTSRLLQRLAANLDYAWDHARDEHGLFGPDWAGREQATPRWLLDQAAMVECNALLAQETQ